MADELDWKVAKGHFDAVRQQYLEIKGMPQVNVEFALRMVFDPLSLRYRTGERSKALYDEMMAVE
jgi:hypothetical protein